jgi:hypothetical protein
MWVLFNVGDPYNAVGYTGRKSPYRPGEIVYARETWTTKDPIWDDNKAESFMAEALVDPAMFVYRADEDQPRRWRPSMFMPEWASRMKLEIVSVKPEQIQVITEGEAVREGVEIDPVVYGDRCYLDAFVRTWKSVYPGSWERNDWVWRIELKEVWRKTT